jgi:quinohemoprotein ethanol dehydrogenase
MLVAAATVSSIAAAEGNAPVGAGANWATHEGDSNESGYSRLGQIDTATIGRLGLSSSIDLPGEVTLEATPLAVDGTLYFTGGSGTVYATDAVTGRILWKFDPQVWKYSPAKQRSNFAVNRGVAYAQGRIFAGILDGRLIALDARTGKLLWSTDTVPPDDIHTITGAPCVFDGKVIIGNAGGDANLRGYVTAYDQATGKQLWRFYTAPGSPQENKGDPAMERAAATWNGPFWKTGTGGEVWNGITFDAELNRIYIGTGNAGPYNPRVRSPGGGDNLYMASIVALDADTGKYVWHYQVNPSEAWDYDDTEGITLATLTIDGKPHRVLMQAPKNGFFYVIDRDTGKLLSAQKTGKVTWADHIDLKTGRPVEAPNIRYETGDSILYPSVIGTHNWQPMSFSPKTGLVYIPFMQLGTRYTTHTRPGDFAFGGMMVVVYKSSAEDGKGALLAWDPVAQKARWKAPLDTIWNGGTLATAGNLVFQGAADGYFSAYDATSGKRLWHFNAGLGIVAAPMSYSVHGKQYVSVLVGYGGTTAALSSVLNAGWKFGAQPRRLLTFSLGGDRVLPPSPPPDMKVHALDDPSLKLDNAWVAKGKAMSLYCIACHGPGFAGAGAPAPDLRESHLALSEDAFRTVVHDGTLMQSGMPRFEMLSRDQVHAIYQFLRASAREALGRRDPSQDEPSAPPPPRGGGYATVSTQIGALLDDPAARKVVDATIPGFSQRPQIGLARSMTLKQIQFYSPDITDAKLAKIDAGLAKLPPKK